MTYEFRLYPTKSKRNVLQHNCASIQEAKAEARGMMYAMMIEHKHPMLELYKNGKLLHKMA